jgi:2-desacetyl-2-hydroxyethyl bacteriochlorophyllide A dehydrogenase
MKGSSLKTITLSQPGAFVLSDTAPPEPPQPGEALVRVHRVGICGTDLHAFRGRQPFFTYPRILGHELGVEILALGNGETYGLHVGDRCAVEPYLNCGVCIACRRGKTNCCASLKVLGVHTDGGMREIITVPVNKLHRSENLSVEQLALVETLGIGAHAVDRARIDQDEWTLVIGAGPIGLAAMQFAQAAGARVIALDINADRLAFCKERLRVDATVDAGEDALERVREITEGDLPTAVFDATGNAGSMMGAFQYVASGGRLVYIGLVLSDITFHDPDFHRKEITLLATRNSTGRDFVRIIGLLESGQVDTAPWITHRAEAASMPDAFPGWLDPASGVLKAVVSF